MPDTESSLTIVERITGMLVDTAPRVLGAIVFLIVAWVAAAWVRRLARKALERAKVEPTLARFLSNLSRMALIVLSVVACLGIFGVQTASFAAVIGSAGIAIGLGLQGSLSHLAAGVLLMVTRPFKSGDVVSIAGQMGVVDEIELFSTHIDTPDNRRLIVPNGQVFGSLIENLTRHPIRRADVDVGVDYAADLDTTREVLLAAANRVPGRATIKDPEVFLRQLGPSSVDWQVRVWAPREDFGKVRQAAVREVKKALDEAGLVIPFPQLTISRRA